MYFINFFTPQKKSILLSDLKFSQYTQITLSSVESFSTDFQKKKMTIKLHMIFFGTSSELVS